MWPHGYSTTNKMSSYCHRKCLVAEYVKQFREHKIVISRLCDNCLHTEQSWLIEQWPSWQNSSTVPVRSSSLLQHWLTGERLLKWNTNFLSTINQSLLTVFLTYSRAEYPRIITEFLGPSPTFHLPGAYWKIQLSIFKGNKRKSNVCPFSDYNA